MSNEELAVKIKAGELDLIPELWGQTRKLIKFKYKNMIQRNTDSLERFKSSGITLDDLEQEGYFALLEAIKAYKPETGYKFATYLTYPLMNHFFTSIGLRTSRQKGEPLFNALSLDKPISDENESLTLSNTIVDDNSQEEFWRMEQAVYKEQLHTIFEYCLATLEPIQEKVVREKYYNNKTLHQIAVDMGFSTDWSRQLLNKAFRKLREPKCSRLLIPFIVQDIKEITPAELRVNYYIGGLQSFRNRRASTVELNAERLERYKH